MFLDPDYVQSVTQSSVGLVSSLATLYGSTAAFTQSTDANKPILSRPDRVENWTTNSEDFSSADFTQYRLTVVANSVANPVNGATTADTLVEDNTSNSHVIAQNEATISGNTYRFCTYAKGNGRDLGLLMPNAGAGTSIFDLDTCTLSSAGAGTETNTIEDVGGGWCRACTTDTATTTGINAPYIALISSGNSSYLGDGASGVYVFGAQFQRSSMQPSYIATTTAPVYGSLTGRRMLTFDGTNDAMTSTSIASELWGLSAKTTFAVGVPFVTSGTHVIIKDSDGTTKTRIYVDTNKWAVRNSDGSNDTESTYTAVPNEAAVFMAGHNGTNLTTWLNRSVGASVASGATSSLGGTLQLGSASATNYWNGQLGPIITYNRVLTQPERDMIRQILQKFWRVG
jgi:hypothetical protein